MDYEKLANQIIGDIERRVGIVASQVFFAASDAIAVDINVPVDPDDLEGQLFRNPDTKTFYLSDKEDGLQIPLLVNGRLVLSLES